MARSTSSRKSSKRSYLVNHLKDLVQKDLVQKDHQNYHL